MALAQPQQIEAFRVGRQQVAQILAGRKDLQQRGQYPRIAFKQRSQPDRIPRRADEALQVVQRHVGVGTAGQSSLDLIENVGQQIECHAGPSHAEQVGVSTLGIDYPQSREPIGCGGRVVQITAGGLDIHKAATGGRVG